jgi:hypothetical protein
MPTYRLWWFGVVGGALLFLAACAGGPQPYTYQPDNELKPGPGLFTGEEGMWTVVGPSRTAPQAAAEDKTAPASKVKPEGAAEAVPPSSTTD